MNRQSLFRFFTRPFVALRARLRRAPAGPPPEQLTADIWQLDHTWRKAEQVRDRQLAASTRGGRG